VPPSPAQVLAVVTAVAARLDTLNLPWHLAGSTGRLLLGLPARPGDIDLEVRAADAAAVAEILGLPEPAAQSGGGWSSHRASGALAGVPLDLSAGLEVEGPGGMLRAMDAETVPCRLGTATIHVVAPGEALARAMVAGDAERIAKAAGAMPADEALVTEAMRYAESRRATAAASAAR
jgi:hypothetical protein